MADDATATSRLGQLRAASPAAAVRLVYRKAIYRKVSMGRWGARAGDHVAPERPVDLRTEVLGPDRYDVILDHNPYLTAEDLEHFHRQDSRCITVYDGGQIASSSWMTRGEVWIHELQRHVPVPTDEHFSCRSYVSESHRGRSLLSHMISSYALRTSPDDVVWGLVYEWNVASSRSLERIGWEPLGEEWSTYVLGRQVPGGSRTLPRPRVP